MKRKCALYVRVSTEDQNYTHQIKALKTFTSQQDIKVYKIYKDEISGSKSTRPALNDLMNDMRQNKFSSVIVWKLDRLGRSLQHLLHILEEFNKRDIDFISMTEGFNTDTAHGRLFFQIAGAFAEFERSLISERTILALKHNRRVGKRGKDKGPRKTEGYIARYQKKGGGSFSK